MKITAEKTKTRVLRVVDEDAVTLTLSEPQAAQLMRLLNSVIGNRTYVSKLTRDDLYGYGETMRRIVAAIRESGASTERDVIIYKKEDTDG